MTYHCFTCNKDEPEENYANDLKWKIIYVDVSGNDQMIEAYLCHKCKSPLNYNVKEIQIRHWDAIPK